MVSEIENLMTDYLGWLKDHTHLRQVDADWVEISTPHLDRHNDCLQIYIRQEGERYLLTDDGYILRDLEMCGCPIDSPKRKELLGTSLRGFGVEIENDTFIVKAAKSDFAEKKHNLLQAMLTVNDMFQLAQPTVMSLFTEDIANWLDLANIRTIANVKFTGDSKFDHYFDFAIPGGKDVPERILKAINQPNKDSAQRLVFSWIDTKKVRELRKNTYSVYAVLNDQERKISGSVTDALTAYGIIPMPWSEREGFKAELAA